LIDYIAPANLLQDRYILVTGASGGLGGAVAKAAAAHGATVVLMGRSIKKLEALYDEIEQAGHPQPAIYPLDMEGASAKDYADLVDTLRREFGALHAVVHCAASLGNPSPLQHYVPETWSKVFATNLHGPFLLTQACIPLLQESKDARIIFTLDDKSRAYWGAYGVSKAGVEGMMKIFADELENQIDQDGATLVTVSAVAPGPMSTRLRAFAYPGEARDDNPLPETKVDAYLYLLGPEGLGEIGTVIREPEKAED
jgi:NAD(P)-dependent dehydrogenase (short-subunit alcohol dehydrogenase family)